MVVVAIREVSVEMLLELVVVGWVVIESVSDVRLSDVVEDREVVGCVVDVGFVEVEGLSDVVVLGLADVEVGCSDVVGSADVVGLSEVADLTVVDLSDWAVWTAAEGLLDDEGLQVLSLEQTDPEPQYELPQHTEPLGMQPGPHAS